MRELKTQPRFQGLSPTLRISFVLEPRDQTQPSLAPKGLVGENPGNEVVQSISK